MHDDDVDVEQNDDLDSDSDETTEESSPLSTFIDEGQREFINGCIKVVETTREQYPEAAVAIEQAVEGVIQVIEGNGVDEGYILIKREDDLAMLPATLNVVKEHYESYPVSVGLDLAVGLSSMFSDINN